MHTAFSSDQDLNDIDFEKVFCCQTDEGILGGWSYGLLSSAAGLCMQLFLMPTTLPDSVGLDWAQDLSTLGILQLQRAGSSADRDQAV